MPRHQRWGWLVAAVLLCIAPRAAEASGTYFRPGTFGAGRFAAPATGQFRVGLRFDYQRYTSVRLYNGLMPQVAEVKLRSYSLTGEYGLSDHSSLYGVLPYVDNDSRAGNAPDFAPESGFGDMKLGYNRAFDLGRDVNFVFTPELNVPMRNYSTKKLTAPGDNSVDLTLRGVFNGDNLFKAPLFYSVGGGVRVRASDSADQLLYDAEFGVRPRPNVAVSTFIDSINSTNGWGLGQPGFNGDFALLRQTVTRWGGRVRFSAGAIDGEVYAARAIQYQNQAPFEYYGVSVFGRF